MPKSKGSIGEYLTSLPENITGSLTSVFGVVTNIALTAVTVPFILFYMLKDGHRFPNLAVKILPDKYKNEGLKIFKDLYETLAAYIQGQAHCLSVRRNGVLHRFLDRRCEIRADSRVDHCRDEYYSICRTVSWSGAGRHYRISRLADESIDRADHRRCRSADRRESAVAADYRPPLEYASADDHPFINRRRKLRRHSRHDPGRSGLCPAQGFYIEYRPPCPFKAEV